MAGIEKLKVALKFAIGLTEGVIEALDDKKLTWLEIVGLSPKSYSFSFSLLIDLPGLIRDHEELWLELEDLDEAEREELLQYAKDEFDLNDDQLEGVIESALEVVTAIANLAFDIKALKEPEA